MYVKELIKKLEKYSDDYLVRVRIDKSFWEQEGVPRMSIHKKTKDAIDHTLHMPNYWVEEIENSSVDDGKEITLWGYYC